MTFSFPFSVQAAIAFLLKLNNNKVIKGENIVASPNWRCAFFEKIEAGAINSIDLTFKPYRFGTATLMLKRISRVILFYRENHVIARVFLEGLTSETLNSGYDESYIFAWFVRRVRYTAYIPTELSPEHYRNAFQDVGFLDSEMEAIEHASIHDLPHGFETSTRSYREPSTHH